MDFNNILLLSVSLATAQGYVAPRNIGSSDSLLSSLKLRRSSSGASSCQKDDCYNAIFSRNDNGFCRQFNSPSSCNLPSDLRKYSSEKDRVHSACNCYLQQSPSTSSAPATSPTSGPSPCIKNSCYNDIFDRNDNGFCRQFNSPRSCNLPSDLSKHSSNKDNVRSACNCYLQHQSTQVPTSTHAQQTSTSAPFCVKDLCYNDIFDRNDNGFCRQFNSPSSCNLPFDLSRYSSEMDSCHIPLTGYPNRWPTDNHVNFTGRDDRTVLSDSPTTSSHPITTNGPSQPGHTVTITGPESDYTVTVGQSQPAHTVTVSGSSQPAHTVTVSGPSQTAHTVTASGASQPAHTVTVSSPSQPAHTITVSAPATKTCPSASTFKETCTVTKTLTPTAQATCSPHSASVITKTCTVTKTATCNGPSSTIHLSTTQK